MIDGIIKYQCNLIDSESDWNEFSDKINLYRNLLKQRNLIGVYNSGEYKNIGFGNISHRIINNEFLITGSQTAHIEILTPDMYSLVYDFDWGKNILSCRGKIQASSESMTHGIIYKFMPQINSIIHIHNEDFWKYLLNKVPTTPKYAEYGSQELVSEVIKLIESGDLDEYKVFVSEGHKDGIFFLGEKIEDAYENLNKSINQTNPNYHQ